MTYHEELMRAIAEWSNKPIQDEWSFASFRERVIGCMSADEAFQAIGVTVAELLNQTDESNAIEVLQTVIDLARRSDTTEVHPELIKLLPNISKVFGQYGEYAKSKHRELLRFYRIDEKAVAK